LPRKSRSVILMNFMKVSLERSPPLEYKLVRIKISVAKANGAYSPVHN
jgi:hypothetical protein